VHLTQICTQFVHLQFYWLLWPKLPMITLDLLFNFVLVILQNMVMSYKEMSQIKHVGFLTLHNFSMIAFSNALEILRMTNYLLGEEAYQWSVFTANGEPAIASNGLSISATTQINTKNMPDLLLVCGGVDIQHAVTADVIKLLTQTSKHNLWLGGLCTGSYALAKAGLLDGYKCTIHWENMASLCEEFSSIKFMEELFVIDRNRCTCAGGTAPLDLMLAFVDARFGKNQNNKSIVSKNIISKNLVAEISDQFMMARARDSKDQQHIPVAARVGYSHKALVEVSALMEANIEEPLSLDELARLANLSQRHLQRMFKHTLNMTPMHYYLNLRLRRARALLLQTEMSVMSVTVACGFQSSCHFSKSYRTLFGYSPSMERNQHRYTNALTMPKNTNLIGEHIN
jgi:AraC family transcriptional regulator, glycine betaine-responsive activator